ncbi:thioesterase II family protein [Streptomyces sp. NPDC050560]|uniref:thioesterase II family protein n=1 Tax=Streptomyces sp. NPDC050560 TaxID=3365630 RepID=UPI00378E9159
MRSLGRVPHEDPEAPALVLFPHAGGSANFYRQLAAGFPPALRIRVVQYPGRETRVGEDLVDDMTTLADRAAAALRPLLGAPLALFGHSMGALVAYEVARRLESDGTTPDRLFASARHAPVPGRRPAHRHHQLDDERFTEVLRRTGGTPAALLDNAEMRDYVLPIVRNDYRLLETYVPAPGPPLRTPVVSIAAEGDGTVTEEQVALWGRTTEGAHEHLTYPGGHFYLLERPAELTGAVLARLPRHTARARAATP